MHVTITAVDGDDPDGVMLRAMHAREERRRYGDRDAGGHGDHRSRCRHDHVPTPGDRAALLLLARDRTTGAPVACGELRRNDGGAEITGMFVVPERRGEGLARLVLGELERQARALGWFRLRLETGRRRPDAVQLCRAAGFVQIPNYGRYVGQPESVCFEKVLSPP